MHNVALRYIKVWIALQENLNNLWWFVHSIQIKLDNFWQDIGKHLKQGKTIFTGITTSKIRGKTFFYDETSKTKKQIFIRDKPSKIAINKFDKKYKTQNKEKQFWQETQHPKQGEHFWQEIQLQNKVKNFDSHLLSF